MSAAGEELNIRIIFEARSNNPEIQAAIEKALGGLDLSKYERPLANLSDSELLKLVRESWKN